MKTEIILCDDLPVKTHPAIFLLHFSRSIFHSMLLIFCKNWGLGFYKKIVQREKCPNTEFFLVRIFLYSDWIYRPEKTPYLDTFHAVCSYIKKSLPN